MSSKHSKHQLNDHDLPLSLDIWHSILRWVNASVLGTVSEWRYSLSAYIGEFQERHCRCQYCVWDRAEAAKELAMESRRQQWWQALGGNDPDRYWRDHVKSPSLVAAEKDFMEAANAARLANQIEREREQ